MADEKQLLRALELAAIRLGILADRMEGCNDEAVKDGRFPVHELLSEARMFELEARTAAGMESRAGAAPMTDPPFGNLEFPNG